MNRPPYRRNMNDLRIEFRCAILTTVNMLDPTGEGKLCTPEWLCGDGYILGGPTTVEEVLDAARFALNSINEHTIEEARETGVMWDEVDLLVENREAWFEKYGRQ